MFGLISGALPFIMKLAMWYMDATNASKEKKRRVLEFIRRMEAEYGVSVEMGENWQVISDEMSKWEEQHRASTAKPSSEGDS